MHVTSRVAVLRACIAVFAVVVAIAPSHLSKAYLMVGAQAVTGRFLDSFEDFPPSQRAASFTIDQAMEKLKQSISK